MSQHNPYKYDKDLDDDIFESDGEQKSGERTIGRHSFDGTVCPHCNIVHSVAGIENIPADIRDKILKFLDTLPDDVLQRAAGLLASPIPPQVKLVNQFMNFLVELDQANHEGPLLRAMAEYLDEQSGGQISARWEVYDCERRLLSSHLALKSVNTHLDDAKTNEAAPDVISMLELLVDFMVDRIAMITSLYREVAEKAGLEVNESIITTGSYGDNKPKLVEYTMIEGMTRHIEQ